MPRRSNLFQEVVAIIYARLAGEATQEESAMLANRVTGELREVDVVVRGRTGGHETVVAIEAAGRSRRASVDWVEQMVGKHKNLPTDKVVLVAEAGFTRQARTLALAEGMVPLTPADLDVDDPAGEVVNALPSLWPKTIGLTPRSARVWVDRPGEGIQWFRAPGDLDVLTAARQSVGMLHEIIRKLISDNMPALMEQIGMRDIAEDTERDFTLVAGAPLTILVNDQAESLYAHFVEDGKDELHRIEALEVKGKASIAVSEIKLTHKQLGELDVRYSFGEGSVGGKPALLVVTARDGAEEVTVRIRDSDDDDALSPGVAGDETT